MIENLIQKFVRFLSIAGGFSSPEDIERAKQRNLLRGSQPTKASGDEPTTQRPRNPGA